MPIQPKGASGVTGYVLVDEQYVQGLRDLEGFSHIYLVYSFHKAVRTLTEEPETFFSELYPSSSLTSPVNLRPYSRRKASR